MKICSGPATGDSWSAFDSALARFLAGQIRPHLGVNQGVAKLIRRICLKSVPQVNPALEGEL